MVRSSDSDNNSFAWSKASCSSGDSDEWHNKLNSSMYESETEKSYKKKLHKKLQLNENEANIKQELLNGDNIKPEPDSDHHVEPRKRKRKHGSSVSRDYLEERVKLESQLTDNQHSEPHNQKLEIVDNDYESNELSASQDSKKRKKKSKKRNSSQDEAETTEEIKVEENQTVVSYDKSEKLKKKSKKKQKKIQDTNEIIASFDYSENNIDSNTDDPSCTYPDLDSVHNETLINGDNHNETGPPEQEIEAVHNHNSNKVVSQSLHLKRFLKSHPYLSTVINNQYSGPLVSKDDKIWLVNCPCEIEATSLKGIEMSLDSKFKVKIDAQSYIGDVDSDTSRITVLTLERNEPQMINLPLSGTINLRKRIPKTHIIEDNFIVNNQSDFIPLPDTKCRHPLFGSDYKKSMKIQSSIKSRLNASVPDVVIRKKKKHKLKEEQEIEVNEEEPAERRAGSGGGRKRRRDERSGSPPAHSAPKKSKKQKSSSEDWDSKQAIEENLFQC